MDRKGYKNKDANIMTATIVADDQEDTTSSKTTTLNEYVNKNGRFPLASVSITAIDSGKNYQINEFVSYFFSSSIIIPIDTFSFRLAVPNTFSDTSKIIRGGDIVYFQANSKNIFCGLVDEYFSEVNPSSTKAIQITGRDMSCQLEDNDAISIDSKALYASNISIDGVMNSLIANTRINGFEIRNVNTSGLDLFATEPGESKLSALQRYLEPLNALTWTDGNGKIIVGKPNFTQRSSGKLYLNRNEQDSNVISMSVRRSGTRIPNVVVPVWTGLEGVVGNIPAFTPYYNRASEPSRLFAYNHRVIRTIAQAIPSGAGASSLADANVIINNSNNLMRYLADRFLARENMKELIVEVLVAGHYDDNLNPFVTDRVYTITHDTEGINGLDMYLFEVEYSLEKGAGQRTKLRFCNLNTITSGGETK